MTKKSIAAGKYLVQFLFWSSSEKQQLQCIQLINKKMKSSALKNKTIKLSSYSYNNGTIRTYQQQRFKNHSSFFIQHLKLLII